MARRSLKPQLNQIRTWVRQGRTDAWIAHQLEVSVKDVDAFKREHELVPSDDLEAPAADGLEPYGPPVEEEPDLRAEDDALVAAALDAEPEESDDDDDEGASDENGDDDEGAKPAARRRGRRGGRGRSRSRSGAKRALEGTFDHGDEGYGLWLDPAVQDDPVYAEHWAGHRPVTVSIEQDQIVIRRSGDENGASADDAEPSASGPDPDDFDA